MEMFWHGLRNGYVFRMCINDTDLVVDVSSSYLLKLADDTKWSMVVETEEQSQVFQEGILRMEVGKESGK